MVGHDRQQRPDIEVTRGFGGAAVKKHVDVAVHDLTSRREGAVVRGVGGGEPVAGRLERWEKDKERQRGATAAGVGATFVPFVVSSQGHLGPAAHALINSSLGDRPRRTRDWWRRRFVTLALRGTYRMATAYWHTQSIKMPSRQRNREPVTPDV